MADEACIQRIQIAVLQIPKKRTMNLIASALHNGVKNSTRGSAELAAVVVLQYRELREGLV